MVLGGGEENHTGLMFPLSAIMVKMGNLSIKLHEGEKKIATRREMCRCSHQKFSAEVQSSDLLMRRTENS